jgi:hypothetical protein
MAETHKWHNQVFEVLTMQETCMNNNSGVFIFAGKTKGSLSTLSWTPYYIGESNNFSKLFAHSLYSKAKEMGATHVHISAVGENVRKMRAEKLIQVYKPALNSPDEQKLTPSDLKYGADTDQPEQFISPKPKETPMSDVSVTDNLQETKSKLDLLYQYERHYLELIKEFKEEIKFAGSMQEDLRRERSQFFTQTLREVVQTLQAQEIDKKVASQWVEELVGSYTKSIDLSSDLAKTHVVQVLSIFKEEAKQEVSKAKLDNIG